MKTNKKTSVRAFVALAAMTCITVPAMAEEQVRDRAAAAPQGFQSVVLDTKAVVLRVPLNSLGEENTSAATLRLVTDDTAARPDVSSIEAMWTSAKDISNVPEVSDESIRDGATWGWNYYRYNTGWRGGYNYYNYRPYGYYYGNYYNYYGYTPLYYTYYTGYTGYTGTYGYRYYYWGY